MGRDLPEVGVTENTKGLVFAARSTKRKIGPTLLILFSLVITNKQQHWGETLK